MAQWIWRGLVTGITTTRYPDRSETSPGISPGLPSGGLLSGAEARAAADICPTGALSASGGRLAVDQRRCVHCFRCARALQAPAAWGDGYEWSSLASEASTLGPSFEHSIHVLVVDAGDCGACLNEARQLTGPYYNIHRLGFFITPTPRQADVLLVVGPVTDHMRLPLEKAFDAMPGPKRVIAAGACALSSSVFGPSFVCGSGVNDVLPVDVEVPGHPPPPLAMIHALLVVAGRRPPASLFPVEVAPP